MPHKLSGFEKLETRAEEELDEERCVASLCCVLAKNDMSGSKLFGHLILK